MQISNNGIAFIRNFEGCYLRAYDDLQPNVKLTSTTKIKGTITIGVGHTGKVNGQAIAWNTTITLAQADELLKADLQSFVKAMNSKITNPQCTQNMFDALVSMAFNCGANHTKVKECYNYINSGDFEKAADAIKNGACMSKGIVLPGLVRRRNSEYELFITKMPKKYSGKFPTIPSKGFLGNGDRGSEVMNLQRFLNWYGNYNLMIDGIAGDLTVNAIKNFQKKNKDKLVEDAKFGKKSLEVAKSIRK